MKNKLFSQSIIVATVLLATSSAFAQYTVQLGLVNVDPQSNAGTTRGPFTPSNALSLVVKPQTTVFFSVARPLNDVWDVQLALGAPPTHDVNLKIANAAGLPPSVVASDGQKITTVQQIAPTLFLNYNLADKSSAFRPFVGIGINYTMFNDIKSTPLNDAINGGTTTSKLSDSWGLAAQIGATYKLSGPWSITGAWSTADVKTTATTNTFGIERKTDIKFSPNAFILAVGYTF